MWSEDSLLRALGAPPTAASPALLAAPEPTAATPTPATTATDDRPDGDLERYQVRGAGLKRSDLKLTALHVGSRVTAGTVLGRTGSSALRFAVRPAGEGTPRIDPRPIVDGWERLDAASSADRSDRSAASRLATAGDAAAASDADAGSLLLLGKEALQRRVLDNPRIDLRPIGRQDVETGQIDRRVLATLEYLTADGTRIAISSLRSDHGRMTASGNVSAHSTGAAVDIASVNGTPIAGHQGAGSITETTIRRLLRLQGAAAPNQIISLMTIDGAPTTLAMDDHADHVHVGFPRTGTDDEGRLGAQVSAALTPSQWPDLVDRLGAIDNPDVRTSVSKAATKADD
jgi:hypothetical protein